MKLSNKLKNVEMCLKLSKETMSILGISKRLNIAYPTAWKHVQELIRQKKVEKVKFGNLEFVRWKQ